eukprot:XP_001696020.1 predicted protein [Chlamydomonas reinhardtii]
MPSESELLVRGPRSDEVEPLPYDAGPETEALRLQAELTEQHRTSLDSANSATQAPAEDAGPLSRELSSVSLTSNASATVVTVQPSDTGPSNTTPRRPRIWQLPFCAADTSWLHVSNTVVYFVLFCVNVLVNSEAVWPGVRQVDRKYGPIVTPAGWAYHIRDLTLFLWGMAMCCQGLVLWYSDTIWLVLHVSGSPAGLALAPFFSFCALVAALAVQTRLAWAVWDVHLELQEEGFEGVPPLGYLFYVYPCSLASGWLLVLHCHATTVAVTTLAGADQVALTAGCVSLVLATAVALLLLVRFRDVVFGLAFTWSMASIWVAGFSANDDYRPDQLVAFFCALVLGLLTYCIAAGPQLSAGGGGAAAAGLGLLGGPLHAPAHHTNHNGPGGLH